jgi:hypothetical protein
MLLQVINLSCSTLDSASGSCKLTVYCHDMGGFTCSAAQGNMPLARQPEVTDHMDPLNRTDATAFEFTDRNGTQRNGSLLMTPLLYFWGDANCHVAFTDVKIQNIDWSEFRDREATTLVSSPTARFALARA